MKVGVLKATNEYVLITGKTIIRGGRLLKQVKRRHKDAFDMPSPFSYEYHAENQIEEEI